MSDKPCMDKDRRNWLIATSAVGGVGAAAALYPFVDSFEPSERAKAAGAAVEIDITGMKPDEMRTVEWRGKPVWVIRRTPEQVAELSKLDGELADPNSLRDPAQFTPPYAQNQWRSIKPEYLVLVGICTHLGCSPVEKFAAQAEAFASDWKGGFYCPCHGSLFDLAGRVYKNKPAPDNLIVPPHKFLADGLVLIGEDANEKGA